MAEGEKVDAHETYFYTIFTREHSQKLEDVDLRLDPTWPGGEAAHQKGSRQCLKRRPDANTGSQADRGEKGRCILRSNGGHDVDRERAQHDARPGPNPKRRMPASAIPEGGQIGLA